MNNTVSHSIFTQLTPKHLNNINYGQIIYQLDVTPHRFQSHTHRLILTKTHLLLTALSQTPSNQPIFATQLDFQLKFQVQFEQSNCPDTRKIGITFFYQDTQTPIFYCLNEYAIQYMRTHLSKYLNQKGFHTQFKPIKKLGKGNFASVYQAIRLQDHKKFAIKAFSKSNIYNTQNGKQSLINQLQIMRKLSHKCANLLSLQSVYQSQNSIYFVLQLLQGKNLHQVIKQRNGKFTLSQIKQIMKSLLIGLQCMTQNGIMHRDLKPQNIMFRQHFAFPSINCQPVIVDFGLAANCNQLPYLFYRCGTPGFVAPEITKSLQTQQYTPACDMFSLGCIFHLLLTNNAIFPGTKCQQVYKKNKHLQFSIKYKIISQMEPSSLELLQNMINPNPGTRITPSAAINSSFFYNINIGKNFKYEVEEDLLTNYSNSPKDRRINIFI